MLKEKIKEILKETYGELDVYNHKSEQICKLILEHLPKETNEEIPYELHARLSTIHKVERTKQEVRNDVLQEVKQLLK